MNVMVLAKKKTKEIDSDTTLEVDRLSNGVLIKAEGTMDEVHALLELLRDNDYELT